MSYSGRSSMTIVAHSESSFKLPSSPSASSETTTAPTKSGFHRDVSTTHELPLVTVTCKGLSVWTNTLRDLGEIVKDTTRCRNSKLNVRLLFDVSLHARPGQVLAILGPSGCGKTTLLNTIVKRLRHSKVQGHVYFNGVELSRECSISLASMVMTSDKMFAYLTVEETLLIAARFKLPQLSRMEQVDRVELLMLELGLTKCRNTQIGGQWHKGISSGERKRVSIAVELLANPSILVLDEPTSGLDSALSLEMIETLSALARAGRTVILSLHQPRSQIFGMLDDIALMSKGRIIYHGPASDVKDYFAGHGYVCPPKCNPCDFLLDLVSEVNVAKARTDGSYFADEDPIIGRTERCRLSGEDILSLATKFTESEQFGALEHSITDQLLNSQSSLAKNSVTKRREELAKKLCTGTGWARWFMECAALCKRSFKNSYRNPMVCCVLSVVQILMGLLLGGVFFLSAGDPAPGLLLTKAPDGNFTLLLKYGVNGTNHHPILDMFYYDIDGQGNGYYNGTDLPPIRVMEEDLFKASPITRSTTTTESLLNGSYIGLSGLFEGLAEIGALNSPGRRGVAECMINNYGFEDIFLLPTFSVIGPTAWPMQPGVDLESPARSITGFVELMQLLEALILKLKEAETGAATVNAFNVLLNCVHMPPIPVPSEQELRKLAVSGTIALSKSGGTPVLPPIVTDAIGTLITLFDSLTECKNPYCIQRDHRKPDKNPNRYNWGDAMSNTLNTAGCLFFSAANLGFAAYDSLLTFPQERVIFNRETENKIYRPSAYFIAKNIADFPFQFFPSFALVTIFYFMVALIPAFYGKYLASCVCISFAAYGFGYMVSATAKSMDVAVTFGPLVMVVFLCLSGFFVREDAFPAWIGWLKYFSFYRWGFFAVVASQFPLDQIWGGLPNEYHLEISGVSESRVWVSLCWLIGLGFFYRLLGFFSLKYLNRSVGLQQ